MDVSFARKSKTHASDHHDNRQGVKGPAPGLQNTV